VVVIDLAYAPLPGKGSGRLAVMRALKNIIFDFHDVLMDKDLRRTIRDFERLMGKKADAMLTDHALSPAETLFIDEYELGTINTNWCGYIYFTRGGF
jgi:hypothetical protein